MCKVFHNNESTIVIIPMSLFFSSKSLKKVFLFMFYIYVCDKVLNGRLNFVSQIRSSRLWMLYIKRADRGEFRTETVKHFLLIFYSITYFKINKYQGGDTLTLWHL